jgi:hypothetical protein
MTGSWKTTVVGAVIAILVAVQPLIATGNIDWKAVAIAACIAFFGFISKDANVTGGNVSNNQTVPK